MMTMIAQSEIDSRKKSLEFLPNVIEVLEEIGECPIEGITIVREPLSKMLTSLLNLASLGVFKKRLAELPYENLFHLFLVIDTPEGRYVLEKNEAINISKFVAYPDKSDQMTVALTSKPKDLTINSLLALSRKNMGDENFFVYSASINNCQNFAHDNLKYSSLGNEAERGFIVQDSQFIFQNSPHFAKLCDEITNRAATGNRWFQELHEEGEREAEIVREKILKLQAETKNELETGGKDGCVCMFA